jgi:ferredoxin
MSITHKVEIHHQGKAYNLEVAENEKILEAASKAGVELPSSCHAGVCTTCAAQITNQGKVDQTDGMGVSPQLQAEGYVLLCVAYPRSELVIVSEKEEEVYNRQFGKP